MPSNVYYLNDRAGFISESVPFKALKLCRDAGIREMIKPGDKVAIKVHMGEYATPFNLRPHWVKAIVEEVQRLGGEPAIVDCSTVVSSDYAARAVEADHLKVASDHGFNEQTMGCPIVIADGAFGFDDVEVPVPNGVLLKHSYIGKKLLDFDKCIVVTHFKGHSQGVYGGALKNVGIGMGSKHGKIATHSYCHPTIGITSCKVNEAKAVEASNSASYSRTPQGNILIPKTDPSQTSVLDRLMNSCPHDCFSFENGEFVFHKEKCTFCANCLTTARFSGVFQLDPELPAMWPTVIADAAAAYITAMGKDNFLFVNYAFDITPTCDCNMFCDRPMIPNLGVFVSRDPVAVDMACLEACEAASVVPGSKAEEYGFADPNTDRFTNVSSATKVSQWSQINAAVYNGIGSSEYTLVESVPAPESDFWFAPYTPDNTIYDVYREQWAADHFDYGDCFYPEKRLSREELYKRPGGLHDIKSIAEVEAEKTQS